MPGMTPKKQSSTAEENLSGTTQRRAPEGMRLCFYLAVSREARRKWVDGRWSINHMDYSAGFILFMEIVGIVAFASSGAMLAIRSRMDLFGVCVLGVTTSVGGGVMRDLILGISPPSMFRKPVYTLIAVIVSVLLFLIVYFRQDLMRGKIAAAYDRTMMVVDAVGLGVFTVSGLNAAWNAGFDEPFLLVFVGVITGVGGGLLRDVIAQKTPYILTRHIYACASIMGALTCVYSRGLFGNLTSMIGGIAMTIGVRLLAMYFRWNLPRVAYVDNGPEHW